MSKQMSCSLNSLHVSPLLLSLLWLLFLPLMLGLYNMVAVIAHINPIILYVPVYMCSEWCMISYLISNNFLKLLFTLTNCHL